MPVPNASGSTRTTRSNSSPLASSGVSDRTRDVGQVGVRGGGLSYSTGDYIDMDAETIRHASECPPTPRVVNMNRIGAALTGEVTDPPVMSLYVFASNPAAIAPNTGLVVRGLMRE